MNDKTENITDKLAMTLSSTYTIHCLALSKLFLVPTETCILNDNGYKL